MITDYKFPFRISKFLRAGILTILISITSLATAQNSEQKIALNVQNVSMKEFIKIIESKTNYTLVYRDLLIDDKKDITISTVEKSLSEILK